MASKESQGKKKNSIAQNKTFVLTAVTTE